MSLSAVAVFVVACAYAGARAGEGWATPAFWVGQLVLFCAAALAVLGRRPGHLSVAVGVLVFSAAQYVIKIMYSPLQLKFADELQHERSATDILNSGHLFIENFGLPISGSYPGLESVAVGLQQITGVSLHVAELITAGVAHMLLAAAVLVLLYALAPDPRVTGAAALFYCFGSYQAFFASMFIYQTLALPLAALLLGQIVHLRQRGRRGTRFVIIGALSAAVVVTHHVTAGVLALVLLGCTVAMALHRPSRPAAGRVLAASLLHIALLVAWTLLVASDTIDYLREPVRELFGSVSLRGSGQASPGSSQPLAERAFTYGSVLIPLVVLVVLGWLCLRHKRRTAAVTAGVAVLVQLAVVGVRLAASNGTELAGRAYAFTSLYCAAAAAVAGAAVLATRSATVSARLRRGLPALANAAAVVGLAVLFVGGITSGWPPRYERLPGSYQVAGYESAMDSHTVRASQWVATHLSPGNRFGADFGNLSAVGTIGDQFPVIGDYGALFTRRQFDTRDAATVQQYDLQFLVVDSRLTTQSPPPDTQIYFSDSATASTGPLSTAALDKFRSIAGVDCIYDDRVIQIYDLRGSRYADPDQ